MKYAMNYCLELLFLDENEKAASKAMKRYFKINIKFILIFIAIRKIMKKDNMQYK
jgi:hypothetical protein